MKSQLFNLKSTRLQWWEVVAAAIDDTKSIRVDPELQENDAEWHPRAHP